MLSLITALAVVVAPSRAVQLEVPPSLPCVRAPALREALRARGISLGAEAFTLKLSAKAPGVEVQLLGAGGQVLASRKLGADAADCGPLAQTVAALVASWLDELAPAARSAPPRRPEPPAEPTPTPTPTSPRAETAPEPEPAPAPPPPEPEPEPAPAPAPPPTPPAVTAPAPAVIEREQPSRLDRWREQMGAVVLAGGGLRFGPNDQLTGAGALTAEWGFWEPFGLALDVGLESDRNAAQAPGNATAAMQWGALLLRAHVIGPKGAGLTVSAGGGIDRISASARGFSETRNAWVLAPSVSARIEWRQPLVSGLQAFARVGVRSRFRDEAFVIDDLGRVLTVPFLGFEGTLGLAWRIF